jgi:hypothetical protein
MEQQSKKRSEAAHKGYRYRYQVAEEVLLRKGSNAEIQKAVMDAFPDSAENPTRAQFYRRMFEKHGRCGHL